jgi:hypothetical protein
MDTTMTLAIIGFWAGCSLALPMALFFALYRWTWGDV